MRVLQSEDLAIRSSGVQRRGQVDVSAQGENSSSFKISFFLPRPSVDWRRAPVLVRVVFIQSVHMSLWVQMPVSSGNILSDPLVNDVLLAEHPFTYSC